MRNIVCTNEYSRCSLLEVFEKRKTQIPTRMAELPGGTCVAKSDLFYGIEKLDPACVGKIVEGTESNPVYHEQWLREASHFALKPGQKIGKHSHVVDMEMWVFWWYDTKGCNIECSFCPPGKSHEWVNNKGCIVHVYAIKWWATNWA